MHSRPLRFPRLCKYNISLWYKHEKGETTAWEWLNKRWSKKIGEGSEPKRFTSARYVSHFYAPGGTAAPN